VAASPASPAPTTIASASIWLSNQVSGPHLPPGRAQDASAIWMIRTMTRIIATAM
jgi:hypothetical protein